MRDHEIAARCNTARPGSYQYNRQTRGLILGLVYLTMAILGLVGTILSLFP